MITETKSVLDVLRDARGLIAKGWTQGEFSRDANGDYCPMSDPAAACFCAMGAVYRVTLSEDGIPIPIHNDVYALLCDAVGGSVVDWNDRRGRTQAEVLAVFDRAIAAAEARQ